MTEEVLEESEETEGVSKSGKSSLRLPAIRVNQWLDEWNSYRFSKQDRQRKPEPHFYMTSIPAGVLLRLSNVPRRGIPTSDERQQAEGPRVEDLGIQRALDRKRTGDISDFLKAGYPWADLRKIEQDRFLDLKKPGWLPTSLVVNVIKGSTVREGVKPNPLDLVRIESKDSTTAEVILPEGADSVQWRPKGRLRPLEIIDGQHRLKAFDEGANDGEVFELPVVLFDDLDISWQAYLFWTINISPKRIGPSLAYDLYPLLRTERWLEPVPGPLAYRETRAQELTEALWSHPNSPWYQRIGMLGRERGLVTQAGFVRSLTQSFIRRADTQGGRPGGLFGAPLRENQDRLLPWSRSQQAAYLIFLWSELERAIDEMDPYWARYIRENTNGGQLQLPYQRNLGFVGDYTLLATDQGVRGFLQVSNDISYMLVNQLEVSTWYDYREGPATDEEEVTEALDQLRSNELSISFARQLCEGTATFDWRTQATPGLPDEIRFRQALYRTGTGYREMRRQLLLHLAEKTNSTSLIAQAAHEVISALNF